jgi:hypothetical protein
MKSGRESKAMREKLSARKGVLNSHIKYEGTPFIAAGLIIFLPGPTSKRDTIKCLLTVRD